MQSKWKTIIPETQGKTLVGVQQAGEYLVVKYYEGPNSVLYVYDYNGRMITRLTDDIGDLNYYITQENVNESTQHTVDSLYCHIFY